MEEVKSVAQCKALIADNKKRFSKVDTNCMMMAGSFAPQIAEGRLYYETYEDGLCLYSDEGAFRKLFIFWNMGAAFAGFRQDKPVIVEMLAPKGREGAADFEAKALSAGFQVLKRNERFCLELPSRKDELQSEYRDSMTRMAGDGVRIVPCTEKKQEEQVLALWDSALEEDDINEAHRHFMQNGEQTVICALNRTDEVVGTYFWEMDRRDAATGWHLVTREDHFRKGIGSAMLLTCAVSLLDAGASRFSTWIADSNLRSVRAHEKIGFRRSGSRSVQYILQEA